MFFTSAEEWTRVKALAKDLAVRLVIAFGVAIALGLVLLKVCHYGTPASVGQLCGELLVGGLLASFVWSQPAYFKRFTGRDEAEAAPADAAEKPGA